MHFSQDSRLEPLDDTTKQIIGVLLDTKTELNLHTEQILDKQTESDLRAAERHDELVSLLRVAIANKGLPRGDVTDSVVVKARLEDNENAIPYSVWFESIRDREKAIQEAYTNTFKWVWCDPQVSQSHGAILSFCLRQGQARTGLLAKPVQGRAP